MPLSLFLFHYLIMDNGPKCGYMRASDPRSYQGLQLDVVDDGVQGLEGARSVLREPSRIPEKQPNVCD